MAGWPCAWGAIVFPRRLKNYSCSTITPPWRKFLWRKFLSGNSCSTITPPFRFRVSLKEIPRTKSSFEGSHREIPFKEILRSWFCPCSPCQTPHELSCQQQKSRRKSRTTMPEKKSPANPFKQPFFRNQEPALKKYWLQHRGFYGQIGFGLGFNNKSEPSMHNQIQCFSKS